MARSMKYCLLCNPYGNGREGEKGTEAIAKYFLKRKSSQAYSGWIPVCELCAAGIEGAGFEVIYFENRNTPQIKAMPPAAMLTTGLSPAQIVRKKYPKAWSQKHNGIYSIYTGQDKNPKDTPYRPYWATPHGWKIGEGQELKQAWRSAAQSCFEECECVFKKKNLVTLNDGDLRDIWKCEKCGREVRSLGKPTNNIVTE